MGKTKQKKKQIKTEPEETNKEDTDEVVEEESSSVSTHFTKTRILIIIVVFYVIFKMLPKKKRYDGTEKIFKNVFSEGEKINFAVYLTDGVSQRETEPLWMETGVEYGSSNSSTLMKKKLNISVSRLTRMKKMYVELKSHAYEIKYILKDKNFKDERPLEFHKLYAIFDLLAEKRPNRKSFGLMSIGEMNNIKRQSEQEETEYYRHQNMKIRTYRNKVYIHMLYMEPEYIEALPLSVKVKDGYFQPHLDCSQWWSLERDMTPYEDVQDQLEVEINFDFIGVTQFSYQKGIEVGFKDDDQQLLDIEDIKEILTDNSKFYLYTVLTVNCLHIIFSFLSYFHDIKFWKNKKSHHGLSINQVYFAFVTNVVSFLYMLDAGAKFLIIVLTFVELLISFWKIFKVTTVRFREDGKFPYLSIQGTSEYEGLTAEIERNSTRLLLKIMFPIFILFSGYNYYYSHFISHYSFVISTLMSFCLLFGFIEMTPQLFINHKLKTVEHMNWNSMIYKFLNTIIDDLFAFMIPMPFLKRLSMFRDDVVFVIYLYQRWVYRVDNNRTETGFIDDDKAVQDLKEGADKKEK